MRMRMRMSTTLSTEIIHDPAMLAALVPEWSALWRRIPETTPFQSPAWLKPWWDIFAPGRLCTVAVREENVLIGLAPLYLESGPLGLRLLPVGIGISDYCDVLVETDRADVAGALMAAIVKMAPWEIFELTELTCDAAALKLPAPAPLKTIMSDASAAPVLPLPENMEKLSETVPRLRLQQLRRARNGAARRGEVAIVVGDVDNAEAVLQELIRMNNARWNAAGSAGVFSDKRVGEFHAAAIPGLMEAGLVRLYALMIGNRIAAVYYGFIHRGRAYAYLGGFEQDLADESPGLIVMGHAIEQAIREGAREFHFLRGEEAYKFEWGATLRRNRVKLFVREDTIAGS
jgi:CelD/BcsL family acetyltransferase involved in cellulose biosynthesis